MNKRKKKKLNKTNKILLKNIIDDIIELYNLFTLLNQITDHFIGNWNWSDIKISYVDFRQFYGSIHPDNIGTYSGMYDYEDDIIMLNTSSNFLAPIRKYYFETPEIAIAAILDLILHEWCHKIEHAIVTENEIIDKLDLNKLSNEEDETYKDLHNELFNHISLEAGKLLELYLKEKGFEYYQITAIKETAIIERNFPALVLNSKVE